MNNPEADSAFDRQIDHLMDTQGMSYAEAEAKLTGVFPAKPMATEAPKQSRYSHRGGRAYPEPSDSELDPNWNAHFELLSPEQKAINDRGIALARKMGELVMSPEYSAIKDESTREALRQTLIDRHNSDNSTGA